jgi:hypothetical protein
VVESRSRNGHDQAAALAADLNAFVEVKIFLSGLSIFSLSLTRDHTVHFGWKVEIELLETCMRVRGYDPRIGSIKSTPLDFSGDCINAIAKDDHLNLVRAAHKVCFV